MSSPASSESPAAVAVRGLRVAHDGRTLLDDLTLNLAPGERCSIQGSSGCGKTSFLRVIAGLDDADAGAIHLAGREANRDGRAVLPPWERGVQMVFQDLGLWPTRSVRRNVEDALRSAGRDDPRGRAERTLQALGLGDLMERGVGKLSGGEARRLAFARALALEPRVLLLDEPFTSLDPDSRAQGFALLEEVLAATSATVLLVTHDPEEAARLGGRMLRIDGGRLQ